MYYFSSVEVLPLFWVGQGCDCLGEVGGQYGSKQRLALALSEEQRGENRVGAVQGLDPAGKGMAPLILAVISLLQRG